uniref:ATP synthase complex subunit 8 n=1 Tax=Corallianassa coutierei TaxID=1267413 RepID=L0E7B1_CORCW|nr:ATP synthase F0 subunit 8 [Corallianassa coutierei]AGA56157.1 ATP synthase F0 subunit 8 [Corallianassa coutierei]
MPQMAPMFWLYLMLMFMLTLLAFNVLNYFLGFLKPEGSSESVSSLSSQKFWKW